MCGPSMIYGKVLPKQGHLFGQPVDQVNVEHRSPGTCKKCVLSSLVYHQTRPSTAVSSEGVVLHAAAGCCGARCQHWPTCEGGQHAGQHPWGLGRWPSARATPQVRCVEPVMKLPAMGGSPRQAVLEVISIILTIWPSMALFMRIPPGAAGAPRL